MEIIKVKIEDLKPYENNAKIHTEQQIDQIKLSILEFGFNDPIAIDENNRIIEGHGRYIALQELDYDEVECIRLEGLTEEQKNAYTLVHNKLTMNTDFDIELLKQELDEIFELDMSNFGFDNLEIENINIEEENKEDDKYTTKVDVPQYQIKGEEPSLNDLFNDIKTKELIDEIKKSKLNEEQKEFLIKASCRHIQFNYSKIAEYYAHQDKEMQELMEKSALVIIDYEDAIKNGYVELLDKIEEIEEEDENYND